MSFSGENGDGPAVLQLQKWSLLQFQLELSDFCEASISPTRELLLLLSRQCEASLLPLYFGKGLSSALTDNDDPSRIHPDDLQGPSSLLVSSPDQTIRCRPDLSANALCPIDPAEKDSSLVSKYHPIISNVKSFTWGHHGDAYNQFKDSGYREFLIVAGADDITVHAFRYLEHNSIIDSEAGGTHVHGKWVEWGPTQSRKAEEHFTHSSNAESAEVNNTSRTEGKQHIPGFKDLDSSNSNSTQRKWFKTFLTILDTSVTDGKCSARFPTESSLPHSLEVVSFSISDSISKFLDFLFFSSPKSCKMDQSVETVPGQVGNIPIDDSPHGIPGYFSYKAADRRLLYQCSRVFSNSSQRLVGLVLAFSEKASINNEDLQSVPSKIQVVIFMFHHWGMQWTTAIDLQNQFSSSGPWPEWADFQFSGNFLVCLNTSGLICMWGAETGNFVTQFDVLQSFGMDRKFFSNQETPFVNIDTSPKLANFDEETDQSSRANGAGTSSASLVRARVFRKIMVASHSFLLAVIDDIGVIYVISADEYITEKQYVFEKFVPPSDLGIMANWKIAGRGTVGRQVFHHLTHDQGLPVQNIRNDISSKMKHTQNGSDRRKQFAKYKENQLSMHSSGFTALSQKHCRKMSPYGSEISSAPIRRIFLPLDRFEVDDSICFSSFGITRVVKCSNLNEQKRYKIVHTGLHVAPSVLSETDADICCLSKSFSRKECAFVGESIGCSFQGCLYLVTQDGLSVILPSVSVSSGLLPGESSRFFKPSAVRGMGINELKVPHRPWQIEVLDKILLYEGPEEAEHVSMKNGWDLSFARLRRLQLALHYLNSEEIEKSLDTLVDVNLAEEGILRLLFTSVYQYLSKVGGDNEVALASRLLSLASCFAIKMVRRYGLVEHKKDKFMANAKKDTRVSYLLPVSPKHRLVEDFNSRRLQEMAHFLEVIRNLQSRLATRNKRPGQGEMADETGSTDTEMLGGDPFPFVTTNTVSSDVSDAVEVQSKGELALTVPDVEFNSTDSLTLTSTYSSVDVMNLHGINAREEGPLQRRNMRFLENARDMIARWEVDNLDFKSVVKDALQSGRLPLAVLQLHLQRQQELSEKGYHDMFSEVREIGRAICYDLFLKGESALAMTTLQRLGEDIETILRQLLFGTVSRSLRAHVLVEMIKYGWLRPHEWKLFERISVFERLYPSSSFWKTFLARQNNISGAGALLNSPEETNLKVKFLVCDNITVECDDIDGVVIGGWENVSNGSDFAKECDDNAQTGYWACAAAWSDAWDQRTLDRIVLDQPFHMGVDVAWESQLEYHMCHNDIEEIYRLFDVIPKYLLVEGTLKVNLFSSHSFENIGAITGFPDYTRYCSAEALEPVFMDIPSVGILRSSAVNSCSSWLKVLVEKELAKKYIFIKEYWDSTAEIMPLLAHAGFIFDTSRISLKTEPFKRSLDLDIFHSEQSHKDTEAALHILVLRHCINHNLPNLLDLYLDHHNMVLDDSSLSSLVEAAGDCQWAKWLLYTRIKSREYDASFSNARSNMSRQMISVSNLDVLEIDEIVSTVDDIAEGGGEMAALATLMYASIPMQNCLCSGSVNKHCDSSSQCTLENLRPGLQKFPTLWRTLVAACFSQDADGQSLSSSTGFARFSFSDYASWRYNIFSSSEGDTSLIQMLPFWFPKSIRRLIKLSVQGPLGWQSLSGEEYSGGSFLYKDKTHTFNANGDADTRAIEWEQMIQRSVEKMYSSLKGNGFGVEHHLHRGRALAAFNHVLDIRALKLKSTEKDQLLSGQYNIQSDVQMMLSPLTQSEGSLLSSVMPLAIMHFEDSALVASCAFLLELCGLSASMLRVDIAALRRISSYYKLNEHNAAYEHVSPRTTPFYSVPYESDFTSSLARALADDYVKLDHLQNLEIKASPDKVSTSKQPSRSLITVLQHLENASLPLMNGSGSCGLWLSSGNGDGFEFRNQQKDSSQNWSLVTEFCQMHHLPLSTRYLALLANNNDWVGFLTEAQFVGFSIDVVIQVATQEFGDPRLRTHILTVLKNMQSTRRKTISSPNTSSAGRSFEVPFAIDNNTVVPMELFGILAECEREKNPGESLLVKAKDLRWPLLAVIASCFSDVSPLSCLSVWLEITAARETSSIKVNDITSRIVDSVGAAVEATNIRLPGSRTPTFHYNRRNPKRRRIVEPSAGFFVADASSFPNSPSSVIASLAQEMSSEEEKRKLFFEQSNVSSDSDGGLGSLSNMVSVLCEQHLFLPLLRAFEMFMPACSLLPFIRSLQAFSQMRLSEASAHLASFSARIREEPFLIQVNMGKDEKLKTAWTSSTAVKAAEAMLSTCPSAYEKRCLLQLLSTADFGDGGFATTYFRRLHWKINLAEPSLRKDVDAYLGNETLDDASLLSALEKNGQWEQARNWARQLESSGASWKSAVHHVTETQAESMVVEWKEFLWDIPEERAALWNHCQTLFLRYSFPALQAGLFFLKHAEAVEKEIPPKELHEMLLLSLQWLSGMMTQSNPVYPLDLLREIETRVWLLAVESEAQSKTEGCFTSPNFFQNLVDGNSNSIIEQTANIITKMDNHLSLMRMRATERNEARESNLSHHRHLQVSESNNPGSMGSNMRTKRRAKNFTPLRRPIVENLDGHNDSDDYPSSPHNKNSGELSKNQQLHEENLKIEASLLGWEERVTPADLERAVLSLLEFGQMTAAKQLQEKLSPAHVPSELVIVDAALKIAALSSSSISGEINESMLDSEVRSFILSLGILISNDMIDPLQVLESLTDKCGEGCGHGLCRRIIAVTKAARVLGLPFTEAFEKRPLELLQLLSLKAQDSLEEAKLIVQTHVIQPSSIARVLAESFLKGLLAAHRGGYMDSQKEEGPAPLLWRFSDFLKWAELCPSEPEIGHALMRLVMTGQDIPHACEVELLILSHHFYKSSACLDGVDVLVTLAANRVESYVLEGDFSCLARLIIGVSNFHALNFILNILIENGQLEVLLQKYNAAEAVEAIPDAGRGFRLAVLTSLKLFNPHDLDAFAMVYNHFDLKHETAALLESRAMVHLQQWWSRWDKDRQNEDLLESMRHLIEAAEVLSSTDAGHKTHRACARACLISLQIRIPDLNWLELSETNARRAFVEQSRFQEALIVAEAYNLNQPSEWAPVLWNLMLKPDLIEQFVAEFVAVLPLQSSMLLELAKFYRAEVAARGDQSHFSVWLSPGGLPAEWVKHLGRSFRSLLKRTRDLRVRMQLATIATGFGDVINACMKDLDKVPESAGPLILRRGHGGAYLPLM